MSATDKYAQAVVEGRTRETFGHQCHAEDEAAYEADKARARLLYRRRWTVELPCDCERQDGE